MTGGRPARGWPALGFDSAGGPRLHELTLDNEARRRGGLSFGPDGGVPGHGQSWGAAGVAASSGAVAPAGRHAVIALADGGIGVARLPDGPLLHHIQAHDGRVESVTWLGGDRFATGSMDRTVKL